MSLRDIISNCFKHIIAKLVFVISINILTTLISFGQVAVRLISNTDSIQVEENFKIWDLSPDDRYLLISADTSNYVYILDLYSENYKAAFEIKHVDNVLIDNELYLQQNQITGLRFNNSNSRIFVELGNSVTFGNTNTNLIEIVIDSSNEKPEITWFKSPKKSERKYDQGYHRIYGNILVSELFCTHWLDDSTCQSSIRFFDLDLQKQIKSLKRKIKRRHYKDLIPFFGYLISENSNSLYIILPKRKGSDLYAKVIEFVKIGNKWKNGFKYNDLLLIENYNVNKNLIEYYLSANSKNMFAITHDIVDTCYKKNLSDNERIFDYFKYGDSCQYTSSAQITILDLLTKKQKYFSYNGENIINKIDSTLFNYGRVNLFQFQSELPLIYINSIQKALSFRPFLNGDTIFLLNNNKDDYNIKKINYDQYIKPVNTSRFGDFFSPQGFKLIKGDKKGILYLQDSITDNFYDIDFNEGIVIPTKLKLEKYPFPIFNSEWPRKKISEYDSYNLIKDTEFDVFVSSSNSIKKLLYGNDYSVQFDYDTSKILSGHAKFNSHQLLFLDSINHEKISDQKLSLDMFSYLVTFDKQLDYKKTIDSIWINQAKSILNLNYKNTVLQIKLKDIFNLFSGVISVDNLNEDVTQEDLSKIHRYDCGINFRINAIKFPYVHFETGVRISGFYDNDYKYYLDKTILLIWDLQESRVVDHHILQINDHFFSWSKLITQNLSDSSFVFHDGQEIIKNANSKDVFKIDLFLYDLKKPEIRKLTTIELESYYSEVNSSYEPYGEEIFCNEIMIYAFPIFRSIPKNNNEYEEVIGIFDAKLNQMVSIIHSYYGKRQYLSNSEKSSIIKNNIQTQIWPLISYLYKHSRMNDTSIFNIDLLSTPLSGSHEIWGDKFFKIDMSNKKINILSGNVLIEAKYSIDSVWIEREIFTPYSYNYVNNEKELIITEDDDFSQLYSVFRISPPQFLFNIDFDETKVKFEMNTGEFAEFYSIKNEDNSLSNAFLNRPDKILRLLDSSDVNLISIYKRLNELRQYKFGKDSSTKFNKYIKNGIKELYLPKVSIVTDLNLRKLYTKENNIKLSIVAQEDSCYLEGFNVWVNGVPIYGDYGEKFTSRIQGLEFSQNVDLSVGKNVIEVAVYNCQNYWSKKERYVCYYIPFIKPDIKTYFVGIGMNEYQDSTNNLLSSAKDIRDVVEIFSDKKEDFILLDTLINTKYRLKQKFRGLKDKLLYTNPYDKIILMLSGHGFLSRDNLEWHFATYQTDFNNPDSRYTITYDDINWFFDEIPARNRLIIIDACHAGQSYFDYVRDFSFSVDRNENEKGNGHNTKLPFKIISGFSKFTPTKKFTSIDYEAFKIMTGMLPDFSRNGSTILTASRGEQTASETTSNGFLTKVLLEILREREPGSLTINELIFDLNMRFSNNEDQKPSLKSHNPSNNWMIW